MTNVLVAYASKHGSTEEIAEAIAASLRECGLAADCVAAGNVTTLESYDAVVLGSAVYMRRWRREARRFLHSHADALARRELWIFSSGPLGDPAKDDADWSEPAATIADAERIGAREHVVFGGSLRPEPEGLGQRAMAKNMPPEYRDRRDWEEICAWATGIASQLLAASARS